MARHLVICTLLWFLCALAVPGRALAAPSEQAEAELATRQGVERFKTRDYEGAREAFAHAFRLSPRASILFNLALAELHSGHSRDAVNSFRFYLDGFVGEPEPDKAEAVRTKWLPRAESTCAMVKIVPHGPRYFVDGSVYSPRAAFDTEPVSPGEHLIEIERSDNARVGGRRINAVVGTVTTVEFRQDEVFASPPPTTTTVQTPARDSGSTPAREQVVSRSSSTKTIVVASVGGLALLSGIIATAYLAVGENDAQRANELRAKIPTDNGCAVQPPHPACADFKNSVHDSDSHRSLALGFGLTAGGLLVGDLALLLLWPNAPKTANARPSVMMSSTGVSFGLGGNF